MLIAMAGLPASGKSVVASGLQQALPAILLDKDTVRAFLFEDHVDYSRAQNDLCVEVIYDVAVYLLKKENPPIVVLDGRTYSRRYQIDALKKTASRANTDLLIIECVCSDEVARIRLQQDQGKHVAQDRNYEMYLNSKAGAESIEEPRLTIDTVENTSDQCLALALKYLGSRK